MLKDRIEPFTLYFYLNIYLTMHFNTSEPLFQNNYNLYFWYIKPQDRQRFPWYYLFHSDTSRKTQKHLHFALQWTNLNFDDDLYLEYMHGYWRSSYLDYNKSKKLLEPLLITQIKFNPACNHLTIYIQLV